jgi:enoyl-CoA hydratase/carnithine racemase
MNDPQAVLLDWPAPAVARLRINRAAKRNAIDQSVRLALTDALQSLAGESQARALVFGGVGGTFSAGGDLPSMGGEDAMRIGLADALVADADVMAHAVEQARAVAALPADAFARMKARLHAPSASLAEELAREERAPDFARLVNRKP